MNRYQYEPLFRENATEKTIEKLLLFTLWIATAFTGVSSIYTGFEYYGPLHIVIGICILSYILLTLKIVFMNNDRCNGIESAN
jgi:hypothetical protein